MLIDEKYLTFKTTFLVDGFKHISDISDEFWSYNYSEKIFGVLKKYFNVDVIKQTPKEIHNIKCRISVNVDCILSTEQASNYGYHAPKICIYTFNLDTGETTNFNVTQKTYINFLKLVKLAK